MAGLIHRMATIVVVSVVTVSILGAQELRITLSTTTPSTLPGISPALTIELENMGEVPLPVPPDFALVAVTEDGSAIPLQYSFGGDSVAGPIQGFGDVIQPDGKVSVNLTQRAAGPPWFCDPLMWTPGKLKLQIRSEHSSSNWVAVEIVSPTGADAEAWELLSEVPQLCIVPMTASDAIWTHHRQSQYAFFFPPPTDDLSPEEKIALFEEVIALNPNHPASLYYKTVIARAHFIKQLHLITARDASGAIEQGRIAQHLVASVLKSSQDPFLNEQAEYLKTRIMKTKAVEAMVRGSSGRPGKTRENLMIFDFQYDLTPWQSIDDGVMGGVSTSRMSIEDGVAVFEGGVSLENNGGFASVRSSPSSHDLSAWDGLVLRVKGDGQRYKLRLRTTDAFDGVNYEAAFIAPQQWTEVRIAFDELRPVYRGRPVADHPVFDPSRVVTFGLMISDGQEGPFRLELEWIDGFSE